MTVPCTSVVTNSDGEYADTIDYKPTPKRTPSGHAAAAAQAMEEPYHLQDSEGNVRLCFHCNKSAYGGRMMISCEHCPLHWHLDCLSPPLASPPPSTRKWMCPNHADHILVSFFFLIQCCSTMDSYVLTLQTLAPLCAKQSHHFLTNPTLHANCF